MHRCIIGRTFVIFRLTERIPFSMHAETNRQLDLFLRMTCVVQVTRIHQILTDGRRARANRSA